LNYLGETAEEHGYQDLYGKVVKELMMLGIVSFTTFVIDGAFDVHDSEWFQAIHFVHILCLFIAIAFILQVFFFLGTTTLYRIKFKRSEYIDPVRVSATNIYYVHYTSLT
jgi:hypothetical protein